VSNQASDYVIDGETAYPMAIPRPEAPVPRETTGSLAAGRYLVCVCLRDAQGREGPASDLSLIELTSEAGIAIEPQGTPSGYTAVIFITRTNDTMLRRTNTTLVESIDQLGSVIEQPQLNGFAPEAGGPVAWHMGRLWKGGFLGLVSSSFPYWPHLFAYSSNDFRVPGDIIRTLADVQQASLLVGTEQGIWRYHIEEGLQQVADYGVVEGHNLVYDDDGSVFLWTDEGMARAFPFENLTNSRISVPPGARCTVGMVKEGGFTRVVSIAELDGGLGNDADNPRA